MKKENVYVSIKNAKHAKTVKTILKELNQNIALNYWYENAVSEQRKFVMKSEDNVDLYVGDNFYWARKKSDKYFLEKHEEIGDKFIFTFDNNFIEALVVKKPNYNKAFHSKEKALMFIEEQNKPKSQTVDLYFGAKAIVKDNSEIDIKNMSKETIVTLSHGDVIDLQNAINKLNKF